jgi:hypothetical protein
MPKITCNLSRAREAMDEVFARFENLGCRLSSGIECAIDDHNMDQLSLGSQPAAGPEIRRALAATIRSILRPDELEDFIDLLRLAGTEEFLDIL